MRFSQLAFFTLLVTAVYATPPETKPATVHEAKPATEPVTPPAAETAIPPVAETVTLPPAESTTKSAAEPVTLPAAELDTESATELDTEPATEPAIEPATKPATECEPKPLYGVTYAPLALDSTDICLPVAQVKKDMEIISKMAHSVRIYNIAVCYDNAIVIMEAAKKYGMTVLMGLWMQENNTEIFEAEFAALPHMMENYGDIIEYVIVGNEPVFIELYNVTDVIETYERVKTWLADNDYPHETSVAEVWPVWETPQGKELADALDFVCMNMQPYWEGFYAACPDNETDCTPAGEYIHLKAEGLAEYFGKPVRHCESGWPTRGKPCCSGSRDNAQKGFHAVPSLENAAAFVQNFVSESQSRGVKYYVHASFDEEWKLIWDPCNECKGLQTSKHSEDGCGGCLVDYAWGFCTFDREFKKGFKMPEPVAQCHYQ